jgi:hypothetical protein
MGLFNSRQGLNSTRGAVQSAFSVLTDANNAATSLKSALNATDSISALRLASSGLSSGGELVGDIMSAVASFGGGDAPSNDWRVRLSLPTWPSFRKSAVLAPLVQSGGLIFPYTPTVGVTEKATYTPVALTHSNHVYQAYKNSDPGVITITAPWYVENSTEALYWIASLMYLRAATKMFNGNDPKAGTPPPVVKFNAYGNYVFKDVPVVVSSVGLNLANDVDYIGCDVVGTGTGSVAGMADGLGDLADAFGLGGLSDIFGAVGQVAGLLGTFGVGGTTSGGVTHVPTKSTITVTLLPAYSRTSMRKFSLDQFVTGGYMNGSTGFY